jgi:hypothetical protein
MDTYRCRASVCARKGQPFAPDAVELRAGRSPSISAQVGEPGSTLPTIERRERPSVGSLALLVFAGLSRPPKE